MQAGIQTTQNSRLAKRQQHTPQVSLNRSGSCLSRCGRSLEIEILARKRHARRTHTLLNTLSGDAVRERLRFHVEHAEAAALGDMTIELPSSIESALCDSGTVRLLRRVDAEKISKMADGGELQWAFDVSAPESRSIRHLRFWCSEIFTPQLVARLTLPEVIDRILPPSRKFFWGRDVCQLLLISRTHLLRIAPEMRGVVCKRSFQIPRAGFAEWLKARHLGGKSR